MPVPGRFFRLTDRCKRSGRIAWPTAASSLSTVIAFAAVTCRKWEQDVANPPEGTKSVIHSTKRTFAFPVEFRAVTHASVPASFRRQEGVGRRLRQLAPFPWSGLREVQILSLRHCSRSERHRAAEADANCLIRLETSQPARKRPFGRHMAMNVTFFSEPGLHGREVLTRLGTMLQCEHGHPRRNGARLG